MRAHIHAGHKHHWAGCPLPALHYCGLVPVAFEPFGWKSPHFFQASGKAGWAGEDGFIIICL